MGSPRRTPAESVDALSEAIDITRGIWNVSAPGRVRVEGKHYHVPGALRGPKPAHAISIWLPAASPKMRRLVGQKADGWISGGTWMNDVERELAQGNRAIDEASAAAGRDPREVRRLFDFHAGSSREAFVQGSTKQWVEKLLPLATEHGVSVFILVGDDPRQIEKWGVEVAPALREAVVRNRSSSSTLHS